MNVPKIQTTQSNTNMYKRAGIAGVLGAAAGTGARYIIPSKNELSSMINKDAVDKFVSSASTSARGANRSALKYSGIGAIAAVGLTMLAKLFSNHNTNKVNDYSKLGALIDAPDYAVEIMWYGE